MSDDANSSPHPDPADLGLRLYPDPVLKRRAEPVGDAFDDALRACIRRMFDVMYEHSGIGLAAPQVGWSKRLFVVNLSADPEEPQEERVFIDPEILPGGDPDSEEEGCLSFPDIRVPVERPEGVRVRARNADGEIFDLEATDLLARCIQHEFDHLNGVLIIDRTSELHRGLVTKPLKRLKQEYREANEGS